MNIRIHSQFTRRTLLALSLLLSSIALGVALNAVTAKRAGNRFPLADALPRGALVYAQFADLPALLKAWEGSQWKARYLNSTSFAQFQTRHLALKLVARWREFNDASGFAIDAETLAGLADNRAAVAVYDIGKLELVLLAPLSPARQAACRFLQNKDGFEGRELPDGTEYWLHDVEADRGRQQQQIGFAVIKDQFVLATSERLLLRAIANMNGQGRHNRLSDEPTFQALSKAIEPHLLTVWVDQARLNDDWYFRHYWAQANVAELKNLRAGIFDLAQEQGSWIERREFLTQGKARAPLPTKQVAELARFIPDDLPFAQLRSVAGDGEGVAALMDDALFGAAPPRPEATQANYGGRYSDDYFAAEEEAEAENGGSRYGYLSSKFDEHLDDLADESDDNAEARLRDGGRQRALAALRAALQSAQPLAVARLAQPQAIDGPLLAEFRRASLVTLQQPTALDRALLEAAIKELATNRMMIASAPSGGFAWRNAGQGAVRWCELPLPALGRALAYTVQGQTLIVANSPELLARLAGGATPKRNQVSMASLTELTIIRLAQRRAAFDQIFARLEEENVKAYWRARKGNAATGNEASREFFSGEIASLLDVAAPIAEVRIERSYASGRMWEEVTAMMK